MPALQRPEQSSQKRSESPGELRRRKEWQRCTEKLKSRSLGDPAVEESPWSKLFLIMTATATATATTLVTSTSTTTTTITTIGINTAAGIFAYGNIPSFSY